MSSFENWVTLIGAVAWPFVILMLAWIFRAPLTAFIERITGFGFGGATVNADRQRNEPPKSMTKQALPSDAMITLASYPPPTPVAARGIDVLRHDLLAFKEEERQEFLLRALARSRINTVCESMYRVIFGSQIRMLRELHAIAMMTVSKAKEYYRDEVQGKEPAYSDLSFDDWIAYLVRTELVSMGPETIQITDSGREFLQFLHDMRYPDKST